MRIEKFDAKYLEELKELNFMMWLSIQWNGAFHREDAFAAVDDEEKLLGFAGLAWDGTWYYLDKGRTDIPRYRMQLEVVVDEEWEEAGEVRNSLLEAAKEHFQKLAAVHKGKQLCMRCWCYETQKAQIQNLIENGFSIFGVTNILAFDLSKELPEKLVHPDVTIGILEPSEENLKEYLEANEAGYDNVQDSEEELRFRLQGEDTRLFATTKQGKVLSSCTTWKIGDTSYATENVFTVPAYRHCGFARETIFEALRYLKQKGATEATLTVVGDNLPAMKLYFSMGYQLRGALMEMHFLPKEADNEE